jgi:hypothetical protein
MSSILRILKFRFLRMHRKKAVVLPSNRINLTKLHNLQNTIKQFSSHKIVPWGLNSKTFANHPLSGSHNDEKEVG